MVVSFGFITTQRLLLKNAKIKRFINQSEFVENQALAAITSKNVAWVRDNKNKVFYVGEKGKRAILYASQILPKDWILYLKEHPDQFKLHQNGWWYFLASIHKFRTFDFYKELLKLNNVKFLKEKVKSQDIIKSAKAISTINGTIASEALIYTKPLILFGHQSTPFGMCNDVFKITSTKDCEEAMRIIEKGFIPNYSDFNEIVDNYLFELSSLSTNNVEALIDYLVLDKKSNEIKS